MTVNDRIKGLRLALIEKNLGAYIVPSSDPHQSEYVADHWKGREYLSGFTGSAGIVVITLDHAGLWTDSRYFISAEKELSTSEVQLHKQIVQGGNDHLDWLSEKMEKGSTVACDGSLFSLDQIQTLSNVFSEKGIKLDTSVDLLKSVWNDRPSLPTAPIFEHDAKYSGRTREQKLATIRQKMQEKGVNWHFVATLDDIAWTLNLRGSDVESNPVFIANMVVGETQTHLFTDLNKINSELKNKLNEADIFLHQYENTIAFLQKLGKNDRILVDTALINQRYYHAIENADVVHGHCIPLYLKAIKNETEIAHLRQVMVKDGIALVRGFRWLEQTLNEGNTPTEYEVAQKLAECRAAMPLYYGESFNAIIGHKSNGAIAHYHPTAEASEKITKDGILLLDSGGQYHDGTTDITRTIALSEPTAEQKRSFTLVLKGHIALANLKFPAGTKGVQMDILARQFLWQYELNYGHGTGHGVGFFMNVHEPPQGVIAGLGQRGTTVMEQGMYTSNEPGYYKTNEYGIRIENLIIAQNLPEKSENDTQFLEFETITLFPIDQRMIDKTLLLQHEIDWLNAYHERVVKAFLPHLNEEEKAWVVAQCKTL